MINFLKNTRVVRYCLIAGALFSSCRFDEVHLTDLILKESLYYQENGQLYSGTLIERFDDGRISNTIQLKNGIPNGLWQSFGYKGEVVQEGYYHPIQSQEAFSILSNDNVQRLNIDSYKEGVYSITDVYVIVKRFDIDTTGFKNRIEKFLLQKDLLKDTQRVNKVKILYGELD